MKKLKLDLDDLRVESFATAPGGDAKGTVVGYATEPVWTVCYFTCNVTCNGAETCDTCGGGGQTDLDCGSGYYTCPTCDFTCDDYSCQMTGDGCACNYTEGAGCTHGQQVTCAIGGPHGGPCPN